MGYHTEFNGEFHLDKPLTKAHTNYLNAFSVTRRMKRDPKIAETLPDPIREAVGLPIGIEGEYFVGNSNDNNFGQTRDKSIIDDTNPPSTQPGLWCHWTPWIPYSELENDDVQVNLIAWDEGEKFYNYIEWIEYIIVNFLKPWGYVLNGDVEWRGEEWSDNGIIIVKDNVVKVHND